MSRKLTLSRPLINSCTRLAIAALLATAIPSFPAAAVRIRGVENSTDYQVCASRLLRAGISPNTLATACAEALRPEELSRCVLKIKLRTPIAPSDALYACSQVRRPEDVATCVLEISGNTKDAPATDVLSDCRRSLLPISFSECVVALHRKIDISTAKALDTCFDTADLPRSPYRTYQPIKPPVPNVTLPNLVPSISPPVQTTPAPISPVNPGNR